MAKSDDKPKAAGKKAAAKKQPERRDRLTRARKAPGAKTKPKGVTPLNFKQQRVLDHWLAMGAEPRTQCRAYIDIYGCSDATAKTNASRLFRREDSQEYLREARKKMERRTDTSLEAMIRRYMDLANADVRLAFRDGRLIPLDQLPEELALAVTSVSSEGTLKVEGRLAALDRVCRMLGHFEKDNRQRNPLEGLTDLIASLNDTTAPPSVRGDVTPATK